MRLRLRAVNAIVLLALFTLFGTLTEQPARAQDLPVTSWPAAESCPPYPPAKSGQTECWNHNGDQIDCAGTGQDGESRNGVTVNPRFRTNGDGTVLDNLTGLIWLQDANCWALRNWTAALSEANNLAEGSCGLTDGSIAGDWRLPNRKELLSLLDLGQYVPALPPGHPFTDVRQGPYWSSTSDAGIAIYAWTVNIYTAGVSFHYKINAIRVWPVRGPE
jgi:hypothetical protein